MIMNSALPSTPTHAMRGNVETELAAPAEDAGGGRLTAGVGVSASRPLAEWLTPRRWPGRPAEAGW